MQHHHLLRKEPKEAIEICAIISKVVPRQKLQLTASPNGYLNSPATGPSPSSCTHTTVDLPMLQ